MRRWRSCLFTTSLGVCGVVWRPPEDPGGVPVVTALVLPEATTAQTEERVRGLGSRMEPPPHIAAVIERMQRHLAGTPQDFRDIPIDPGDRSDFAARVYRACREVPAGSTVSYGELAKAVGKPGAARAVGRALGGNPLPLLIPCHRVLTATGGAGGFSAFGGVDTKARILAAEGVVVTGKTRQR